MPELKQLRVLKAVAQAGSFSAAADELDYTQPAVSRIVAALERDIGAVLIDRDIRPLRLTDAGRALVRHADDVFQRLNTAQAEVQAIARLDAGTLSFGTFASAGATFVLQALCDLRRQHPGLTVSIAEGLPSAQVRRLRDGDLDLAVIYDFPHAGEDLTDGLELHHLMDDPFELVVPSGHRLAGESRVCVADLAEENWLLPAFGPDSPSLKMIGRACTAAGFEPRIVYRVNDCHMTQAMVAAGEGISLLPSLMLHPTGTGVTVKRLADGAGGRRIAAVRLPARYMTPPAEKFLALLRLTAERHATQRASDSHTARAAGQ